MTRTLHRPLAVLVLFLGLGAGLTGAEPATPPKKPEVKAPALPDLSAYRTVATAVTTRVSLAGPEPARQPGYLGVQVATDARGRLVVAEVEADSPAARAGLLAGDVLVQVAGKPVAGADGLRSLLHAQAPGAVLKLALARKDRPLEVPVTLAAVSRPMTAGQSRAVLGVFMAPPKQGVEGIAVEQVFPDSAAARAGLEPGDLILKVDGVPLTGPSVLGDVLGKKKPGDVATLTLRWKNKVVDLKVTLGAEQRRGRRGRGWDSRMLGYWKKDVYRLAVVGIEYPDVKHNDKIAAKNWEDALFSRNTYVKQSATGQLVHGSLNDYYQEQSYGGLRVQGKVFAHVQVSKKRADYAQSGGRDRLALLTEALDKLLARDGKDALKDFDGIFFLYAGDRFRTNRGGLYWPHRASVRHQGKFWPYFICPEGGARMADISVMCHEFGHLLGLPDLYARPENPGSRGVGVWCAMSIQAGNGRPQHFCAWSKERLGWLKPAVLDPTVKQKLILAPVEDSPRECFKILIRPDASEYLLLENRRKKGFDQSLPGEGLVIWRVVNNQPILVESHGNNGPAGPRLFPGAVPFPSPANNAFTPYTIPSSRSRLEGGLPVHITNIRRLPDGRITFYVGYEYL
jgi:M6 family metalloprotease-like protein